MEFKAFTFEFSTKYITTSTIDAFLIIITLLSPIAAKLSFIEFVLQKVYFEYSRMAFNGPVEIQGLINTVSGHDVLNRAGGVVIAHGNAGSTGVYWVFYQIMSPAIKVYDYISEIFPYFVTALIFGYILLYGYSIPIVTFVCFFTVLFSLLFALATRFFPLKVVDSID